MSELRWRVRETARVGLREYLAANPPVILATTAAPRAVLQCLFFTLLGGVVGGRDGAAFAFVGSIALIICLSTLVGVCDVPMLEKWSGTFYRLELGRPGPSASFALRTLPWVLEALVAILLCLLIVGPITGQAGLSLELLPALPIYLLMTLTSAAAGLAAASPAVGRRADVLVGSAFAYLIVVAGGVLIPAGRVGWLDAIGTVLPIRHGVLGVRALLDGEPWLGHVLAEAGVGLCRAAVAWIAYSVQTARARRAGFDDFA